MKAFRMDVSRCHGCYSCQIACKDEHVSNDWSPYAKPQPEWQVFWGKLIDFERGSVGAGLPGNPKVRMSSNTRTDYVFVPCQHCENAPCIPACPQDAIYTRNDGLVIIDPAKCSGCLLCIDACPYNAIYANTALHIAQKCTGCAHLLDRDGWTYGTRCADNCATGALLFGEESDLDLAGTETFRPELGLTTRVHYLDLPMRFISGTVYDPSTNDVVVGATATLSGDGSGSMTTNGWGDFWFDKLEQGTFSVTISANGKTATVNDISTADADVNLGDIALS